MGKKYLFGIDMGTQGTKCTLFSEDGTPVGDAFEPSNLISPKPGTVKQDPDELFLSVIRTIKEVMDKTKVDPADVAALGIDSQMSGMMGIDKDGVASTYYDSWLDTRCSKYVDIMKRDEENIIKTTGSAVSYFHGPKILWWKETHPDAYKNTAKFMVPASYVTTRMCGNKADKAYMDYTFLHFAGYADVYKMEWSEAILKEFGIDGDKMAPIVNPYDIVGGITKEVAEATGLKEGTPMVAGCGDQAATSMGVGIIRPGQTFDISGTTCLMSFCTDQFSPDVKYKTLTYARSVVKGYWQPMAYTNGSGLCLKWFADNLAADVKGGMRELDELAAKLAPGSEDLMFIPHFAGRVCPYNQDIRGSYVGLNWVHQKPHMFRAIMESIGYEYSYYSRILEELLGSTPSGEVFVIGGGSKSKVFSQIKADILGKKYVTLNRTDGAPLGSAVIAGYGVGIYKDFHETMDKIIARTGETTPNMENHEKYKKYAGIYEDIIDTLMPVYKKLI